MRAYQERAHRRRGTERKWERVKERGGWKTEGEEEWTLKERMEGRELVDRELDLELMDQGLIDRELKK